MKRFLFSVAYALSLTVSFAFITTSPAQACEVPEGNYVADVTTAPVTLNPELETGQAMPAVTGYGLGAIYSDPNRYAQAVDSVTMGSAMATLQRPATAVTTHAVAASTYGPLPFEVGWIKHKEF